MSAFNDRKERNDARRASHAEARETRSAARETKYAAKSEERETRRAARDKEIGRRRKTKQDARNTAKNERIKNDPKYAAKVAKRYKKTGILGVAKDAKKSAYRAMSPRERRVARAKAAAERKAE